MLKKIALGFCFFSSFLFSNAQLKWPAVTSTTKPWTRWWWEGSAVNAKDLTWNLEQYKAAGLGGVELTPIYGVYGYEKQFLDFLSPQWMQMFLHTLKESKRLGLGVDLANGTGWPFGGPWVSDDDASKSVYFKTYSVNGGEQLKELVEYKQEAFVRTANNKPAGIDSILQPVSRNKNLQALALDQIVYPGKLPLKALMAYAEDGKTIDLTKNVDAAGKLNWTAPQGKWNLYALFVGLHGKMVERAAPGGEGYAIDHFSAKASTNYFKKFDEAFKGHDVSYLRAFFNDSYEVDDARGQSNWTPEFFEEFKKRKGYDLKAHLPALFGKAAADMNSRVLYDYRSVIDELLLEHFTQAWKKWGTTKGAMVRNQSHGSPANTLDLYDAVDIPETEGTDILRFKFATSAANVSGKQLAAAESCTWLNEHFLSSWGDVKKAIDLYFLGGVNHIVYHGTEYSPKDAPWPGWLFYAAVHFQPTNPQWKDFKTLNDYITRVQSFLQSGKPDNDVLVYYPIVDKYSETGGPLLQHFDGMERNFVNSDFEHVSKWMVEKGFGFDFFSDRQLQKISAVTTTENLPYQYNPMRITRLSSGGNSYQSILLPANKLISVESFGKLVKLAEQGANILCYKNIPSDVPGLSKLAEKRTVFQQLIKRFNFTEEGKLKKAAIGKGAFYVSDDLETLLRGAGRKEEMLEKGLSFIRRKNADGYTYFITNRKDKVWNDYVPLNVGTAGSSIVLFNPMTGQIGKAKVVNKIKPVSYEVLLQLQPYESIIVQTYLTKKTTADYSYWKEQTSPIKIESDWTIEFLNGGPALPAKQTINKLGSWTELDGEDVKNFSGTAKYSTTFKKPSGTEKHFLLDLGKVNETAEVFLNGKKLTTLIGPTYQTVISSSLLKPTNKLEIIVANLMANRITYMDKNNLPWKIFYNTNMPARRRENAKNGIFDASGWKPVPSGLLGPVTLTPVTYE